MLCKLTEFRTRSYPKRTQLLTMEILDTYFSDAFDELGDRIGRDAPHPIDDRPLDERARQARQASEAFELYRFLGHGSPLPPCKI